jgi:hypothetical protein
VSPSASSKSEALIVTDASFVFAAILPDLYANCREVEAVWKATTAVNDNKSSVMVIDQVASDIESSGQKCSRIEEQESANK